MIAGFAKSTLFAIDYGRRPFCYVRAGTTTEAIRIAERLLAISLRGQVRHAALARAVAKPPTDEIAKLRARRPTAAEQSRFTTSSERDGGPSPYLAGLMAG